MTKMRKLLLIGLFLLIACPSLMIGREMDTPTIYGCVKSGTLGVPLVPPALYQGRSLGRAES